MGNNQKWFDDYEGPKSLGWKDGDFWCGVGCNNQDVSGRVRGLSFEGTGATTEQAIEQARAKFEQVAA